MLLQVLGPFTFRIGDTSNFGVYISGGVATQVKVPKQVDFAPLSEALDDPGDRFVISDFGKMSDPPQLHLAFLVGLRFSNWGWWEMVCTEVAFLLLTQQPLVQFSAFS